MAVGSRLHRSHGARRNGVPSTTLSSICPRRRVPAAKLKPKSQPAGSVPPFSAIVLPMAIQKLFGSVPTEPDLLDKLKAGIKKTRAGLVDRLEDVLSGPKEIDADLLEELEYTLIT
jgi:hypothetical protein